MASITAAAVCAAPSVALAASSSAPTTSSARAQLGAPVLRTRSAAVAKPATWSSKTVSNGSRVNAFNVLNPNTNAKFETLSYLPPLTDEQILAQVNYLLKNKWIPAIEFDTYGLVHRTHSQLPTYYDGRYWVMWKLPLFGANAPEQVLNEVQLCKKEYPDAYVRVIAFDNVRQVQVVSFLVAKPPQAA